MPEHECDKCKKKFKQKTDLIRHINKLKSCNSLTRLATLVHILTDIWADILVHIAVGRMRGCAFLV